MSLNCGRPANNSSPLSDSGVYRLLTRILAHMHFVLVRQDHLLLGLDTLDLLELSHSHDLESVTL